MSLYYKYIYSENGLVQKIATDNDQNAFLKGQEMREYTSRAECMRHFWPDVLFDWIFLSIIGARMKVHCFRLIKVDGRSRTSF